MRNMTLPASLLVLAVWLGLTVGLAALMASGQPLTLEETVGSRIGPSWALALVVLIVVASRTDRQAIGLREPASPRTLRLLWLPALYLCIMALFASAGTRLPMQTALSVIANTIIVGMSEELMFRGILLRGLLTRFRIWPAVLLASLAFGIVHVLNGLATGLWLDAGVQAVSAFMLGIGFMAIRIRTESLYPMMIVHGAWDALLMWQILAPPPSAAAAPPLPGYDISALVIAVPMFGYGLFLLRHLQRDYGHWSTVQGAGAPAGSSDLR